MNGGEWDEAKLEIFLNDHGTHHTGALENENIGIDLDSSLLFFCISLFSFFSSAFLLPLHQRLSSF